MNLLILTQYFHPEQFRINMIAQELLKKGFQITVLTGHPNYPKGITYSGYKAYQFQKEHWNGITIYRVPIIPRGSGNNVKLILNYCSFMLSSSFYSLLFKNKKFDACFVFQPGPIFQAFAGVVLKKFYKIPLYLWTQDLWPESLSATGRLNVPVIEKMIHRFVGFVYRHTDQVLVTSHAFIEPISNYHVTKKPIFLANICEDFYRPILEEQKQPVAGMPSGFKVMFTGNLGSAQALPTLIEAAKLLKTHEEIKWVLVGDGSEAENTRQLVKKHSLENQVYFLGSFAPELMPNIIADADVCLATLNKSPIFSLTLPAKIQSYMACAKPIISAIDGEAARIIKESECGIAVESENPKALAQAVLLLKNKSNDERAEIGKKGRIFCEKYFRSSLLLDKLTDILSNRAHIFD